MARALGGLDIDAALLWINAGLAIDLMVEILGYAVGQASSSAYRTADQLCMSSVLESRIISSEISWA